VDSAHLPRVDTRKSTARSVIVPAERVRYLAEIAATVRDYHAWSKRQVTFARERQQLMESRRMLDEKGGAGNELDSLIEQREHELDGTRRQRAQTAAAVARNQAKLLRRRVCGAHSRSRNPHRSQV
jgi:hypothetical protein